MKEFIEASVIKLVNELISSGIIIIKIFFDITMFKLGSLEKKSNFELKDVPPVSNEWISKTIESYKQRQRPL